MTWTLTKQFPLSVFNVEDQSLIHHSGSGTTYCLSGELRRLFEVFLQQPDKILTEEELQKYCPNAQLSLLNQLVAMHLLARYV